MTRSKNKKVYDIKDKCKKNAIQYFMNHVKQGKKDDKRR